MNTGLKVHETLKWKFKIVDSRHRAKFVI